MREWLDGPKFAEWLEHVAPVAIARARRKNGLRLEDERTYANLGRLLLRWASGPAVSVYTADYYMTFLGLHLHQIPEEIFSGDPYRKNGSRKGHPKVPGGTGRVAA